MSAADLVLFYCPQTRATSVRVFLEELGIPHTLHTMNMKLGEQRGAEYLAINPLGKVPALMHQGVLITEQAAIYMYLADAFAYGKYAPKVDDPARGAYLRWMMFYGSAFEPAVADRAQNRETTSLGISPYGTFETVIDTLAKHLEKNPYMLGDTYSAADALWGPALGWTTMFKIVPALPVFQEYIKRTTSSETAKRVRALDAQLAAEHAKIKEQQAQQAQ